jgi:hypothetical protein
VNFIPLAGEIIVYDTDGDTPVKFKIGDGINYVNVLPFVGEDIAVLTEAEIDEICNATIQYAEGAMF